MQSATYIQIPHNNTHRVSLGKLSAILASLAFWAAMIGGVVLALT
jgi:hypothetical protein